MAIDAQIKHSARKLQNAQKMGEQVTADNKKQKEKLDRLRNDLNDAKEAADAAQGKVIFFTAFYRLD